MSEYSYNTLNVYQDAKALVVEVYRLLKQYPAEERYALCDQIRRATISITSNIAEGMSRYSDKKKIHFLEILYGSLKEVESQLDISVELGYISKVQFEEIKGKINIVGKQLSVLRGKYVGASRSV